MKILVSILLTVLLPLVSYAQLGNSAPGSTPQGLPPGPWLKRVPAPSLWLVTYNAGTQSASTSKPLPPDTKAKKSVAVSKAADLLLEVTTLQNGTSIQHYQAGGLYLTQIGTADDWISSASGVENGFTDTDYTKNDFAGFDWISTQNYVGMKAIGKQMCLVFRDKVVTMDPSELAAIKSAIDSKVNEWEKRQQEKLERASKTKSKSTTAPADAQDPAPPPFNVDNYKMPAEASVDGTNGMPVSLVYQNEQGVETRTYKFFTPPAIPLSLPPAAQTLVDANRARLKRAVGPSSVP